MGADRRNIERPNGEAAQAHQPATHVGTPVDQLRAASGRGGIAAAVATFGLAKVGAGLLSDGLKARERDETIRNEEYYFLWKVRGAAKRAAHRRDV